MATERAVAEAFYEGRALRQQNAEVVDKRLARAVEDVLDGEVTLSAAVKNRGVSEERLRAALLERGWVPRQKRMAP